MTRLTGPGKSTIEVTATPARHGPPLSGPIVGAVVRFALRRPAGDRTNTLLRRRVRWLPIGTPQNLAQP